VPQAAQAQRETPRDPGSGVTVPRKKSESKRKKVEAPGVEPPWLNNETRGATQSCRHPARFHQSRQSAPCRLITLDVRHCAKALPRLLRGDDATRCSLTSSVGSAIGHLGAHCIARSTKLANGTGHPLLGGPSCDPRPRLHESALSRGRCAGHSPEWQAMVGSPRPRDSWGAMSRIELGSDGHGSWMDATPWFLVPRVDVTKSLAWARVVLGEASFVRLSRSGDCRK